MLYQDTLPALSLQSVDLSLSVGLTCRLPLPGRYTWLSRVLIEARILRSALKYPNPQLCPLPVLKSIQAPIYLSHAV